MSEYNTISSNDKEREPLFPVVRNILLAYVAIVVLGYLIGQVIYQSTL